MTQQQERSIAFWLFTVCAVIFMMICLGGITRLTGSGLSMVQWAPITGILPPHNTQQWMAVFSLYQASPEFMLINPGLDLSGFKEIFWFEYFHRLLGRFIGALFFFPMVYFLIRYPLPRARQFQLVGLFLLGGAQGLLGWYMVKSGLVNDPHVSQYRLVAHLALALILYCAIFWLASGYVTRNWTQRYALPRRLSFSIGALFCLIFITLLAGGFVAGTKAGYAYNTFPLMNGQLIPAAYNALTPWWKNAFENIAAIQFNHRALASFSLLLSSAICLIALKLPLIRPLKRLFLAVWLLIIIQYALGIATLLHFVPVPLAALHQAMAVVVLSASLLLSRALWQSPTST